MMRTRSVAWKLLFVTVLSPLLVNAGGGSRFVGTWELERDKSSDIDPWGKVVLKIEIDGAKVTIDRTLSRGQYRYEDSMSFTTDGVRNQVPVRSGKWPEQVHLGVYIGAHSTKDVVAQWVQGGRALRLESRLELETSQGRFPVTTKSDYRLSHDGQTLTVIVDRSTRRKPLTYVFTKAQ